METKEKVYIIDKTITALRKAAVELEEFQVKAALGKADAQDKYEELKKRFNLFLEESKSKIHTGKEKVEDIHTKFDELRVQLALGKAETKEAFLEQKKKLLRTIHELETTIKTNENLNRIYAFVLIEMDKFKVFLEALEQKFEKGKENTKASFEKGKVEFNSFIEGLKEKYDKKDETKWEHFQHEVSEAFVHLKNAFSKP